MADSMNQAVVTLAGRIDSNNAAKVEEEIFRQLEGKDSCPLELDASDLNYISSAGLRVLLRLRKTHPDMTLTGVSSEVYEILEMTGFTEMMKVEKAYRLVSIEGCEEIGRGANGTIYRIDRDNVVKVYNNADALADIQHEREVAKLALILGIPTAISYDVVKVGESYGSVFELLRSQSFAKIVGKEPERTDEMIAMSVDLLKKIHAVELPHGELPDRKAVALKWTEVFTDYLPEEINAKIRRLISDIPDNDHMLHGDYHMKNLMLQDGEALLIDMDTLSQGDPIFEFMGIYSSYVGFNELDHMTSQAFLGIPFETSLHIWDETVRLYCGTEDPLRAEEVRKRAEAMGQIRILSRAIRRRIAGKEAGDAQIALSTEKLLKIIPEVDKLSFEG